MTRTADQPMDGLDTSLLMERYARAIAHARETPDNQASVQSVQRAEVPAADASLAPIACPWCDRPFGARQTGGRARRFCREECRRNFHAAARHWALAELAAGRLTISAIKNALSGNAQVALSGGRDDQRLGAPVLELIVAARESSYRRNADRRFIELRGPGASSGQHAQRTPHSAARS